MFICEFYQQVTFGRWLIDGYPRVSHMLVDMKLVLKVSFMVNNDSRGRLGGREILPPTGLPNSNLSTITYSAS